MRSAGTVQAHQEYSLWRQSARPGKIAPRLLRSIAKGEEIAQDVSTLENPAILAQLKQALEP